MRIENRNEDFPIVQGADVRPGVGGVRPLLQALQASVEGVVNRVAGAMARFGEKHNKTIEHCAKVGLLSMIPVTGAWYISEGGNPFYTVLSFGAAELFTYCVMKY